MISIHTLTQRVTRRLRLINWLPIHFNPHPHAEGDPFGFSMIGSVTFISIHTLTQRVTDWTDFEPLYRGISIHTLTQRVTSSRK